MEIKRTNVLFFPIGIGIRKKLVLIIMRTFIFLFCATVFGLSPNNILSQNTKIKVEVDKTVTVDEVFALITDQTDYSFIYQSDLFKDTPKINLKKGVMKLNDLLMKTIVKRDDVSFILTANNAILIKEKSRIQQKQVSGKVTDESGQPVPGVTVLIKGTTRGTSTAFDGTYTLSVPDPANVLMFSYIGYATQEITVGTQAIINVALKEEISKLDEVTINAGYYKTSKREATGSIAKVDAKTIAKQPVNNLLATLQGRMAGVQITQQSGVPGDGFSIQVRGRNSINSGNEPLYVIDGIPYDSQTMSSRTTSSITNGNLSPFSLINPSDIESIEVLKDGDATAIYGSRGANGVVLITTKKGKEGKTIFNVNVNTGIGKVTNTTDLLNTEQYLEMRREAFVNDGVVDITTLPSRLTNDLLVWDQDRYTDWQKVLFGDTAYMTNFQASASGGTSTTQFLLSGGYQTETTVYPGNFKYSRGSVLAKVNHTSSDERFKVLFSANYAVENNNLPGSDQVMAAYFLPPNAPALYDDQGNLNFENNTFNNPLAPLKNEYESERFNLLANTVLSYRIGSGLELKASLGYSDTNLGDFRTISSESFNPAFGFGPERSTLVVNDGKRKSWIIEPQINWVHPINKGTLKVLVGTTFQKQTDEQLTQVGQGFVSNNLINNLSAAISQRVLDEAKSEYKYQALFGRINYDWKNTYIINLTGRRDGSSRFGPNKQFETFWAIGAAWLFSNEKILKDDPFLSFGKLRGSYGTSGNDQIGDYQFLDTYSNNGTPYNGIVGFVPTRLFNPDFSWEVNQKLEVALELGMLKNRISLSGSYYRNISSNQLVGTPLASTTGFSSIQSNLEAKVRNTGFEIDLSTINFQKENFNWITSFNLTIPKNKLIAFPGLEGSTFANQFVVGESLSIRRLYNSLGVNPDTGVYEFEDVNNDGVISASDDRQRIGDAAPKYYGGLANNLSYKNWSLDFFFQFTKQKAPNYLTLFAFPGAAANQPAAILEDRWQQVGDRANLQRFGIGLNSDATRGFVNFRSSNEAFTDASFIRLKNISLSYTIPESKIHGVQCRLYLQAQNLFTITDYLGADPEQPSQRIPMLKRMNFGVEFNF